MQTLPVVKRGGKAAIINSTLKRSKNWKSVRKYKLEQNMRLKNNKDPDEQAFNQWPLKVGTGKEETHPDVGEDMIKIPEKFKSKSKDLKQLAEEIFPNLAQIITDGLRDYAKNTSNWHDKNEFL